MNHSVQGSENQTITKLIAITKVDSTTNAHYFPQKHIFKPFWFEGSSKFKFQEL